MGTNGFQFYVIANLDKTALVDGRFTAMARELQIRPGPGPGHGFEATIVTVPRTRTPRDGSRATTEEGSGAQWRVRAPEGCRGAAAQPQIFEKGMSNPHKCNRTCLFVVLWACNIWTETHKAVDAFSTFSKASAFTSRCTPISKQGLQFKAHFSPFALRPKKSTTCMQAETSNLVSVQDSSLQRLVGLPGRRYILVGGKGGVGKTSTSAAIAIKLADEGLRTLVLSTDPAHSLGDALMTDLSSGKVTPVAEQGGNLYALEVDLEEVCVFSVSSAAFCVMRCIQPAEPCASVSSPASSRFAQRAAADPLARDPLVHPT